MSAPYTGGSDPGGDLFYCENFSFATPCGTPRVWNPLPGDSIYSNRDIVLLNSSDTYVRIPVGQGYNYQPWSSTHHAIMFDQEFVVARPYHVPLPLNTPYWTGWSLGWQNTYVNLGSCFLIEEGPLQHVGGGLVKFYRRFANLPPTRNDVESYCATFPALQKPGSKHVRFAQTKIVNSRVRLDYFVFDDLNLLGSIPVFPSGNRLNGATGMSPVGLILPEMRYYRGEENAVPDNNQLDASEPLRDAAGSDLATVPSYSDYVEFAGLYGSSTGNAPAEIVIEASSMRRWAGNIYERRTRFVEAE